MDETTISQVNPQGVTSSGSSGGGGKKKILLPIIIIIVLIAIIFGGANYLKSRQEAIPTPTPLPTEAPTATPQASPTPQTTVTPTPKAKATPTKKPTPTSTKESTSSGATSKGLTVRVLNGSGITGRAAATADFLKDLGYEIGGTGNADTDDYDKTTITIKKDKESLLSTLKSDLATKYSIGTTSATLSSSESFDAVVIIGKE